MRTAVDTNVLLDLLAGDASAARNARRLLAESLSVGSLLISPVVYAELAVAFDRLEDLREFIEDLDLRIEGFSTDALVEAAGAWRVYAQGRGRRVQCARCGLETEITCPDCGATLSWRQHILPDFLIGGHALLQSDRLLTRDAHYYGRYFPSLATVSPG